MTHAQPLFALHSLAQKLLRGSQSTFLNAGALGLAAVLGMIISAQPAAARGPSFTQVPTTIDETRALGISPNGRYVTGGWSAAHVVNAFPYRWDRFTGQFLDLGVAESLGSGGVAVSDDGVVYGNGSRYGFAPGNVFRWSPTTNIFDWVYTPTDPRFSDYLRGVSRDGQYGYGIREVYSEPNGAVEYPVIYPFWQASGPFAPIDLNMSPGTASRYTGVTGVANPVNGSRRVYGTVLFPEGHAGAVWTLGFDQVTPDNSWSSIIDVTPNADYALGSVGTSYFIRGDGADRQLIAPITPFILSNPHPNRISDDGQVAVGWAFNSALGQNEAVVWRKGQQPTTLWAILSAAGVSFPAHSNSALTGVSADGSVVIGEFIGTDTLTRAFAAVLPAVNDNCSTARVITYGTSFASTNGATRAGVSGTCASEGAAPDIWFSFIPLANETVTIDTCGSTFDTTLNLFQASSCASIGAALACNDDASPACGDNVNASRITASVFAGVNYYIRVSGWNGASGSVKLTITAPNRPINDTCAQATDVPTGTGIPFNNSNAITDARPSCGGTPFNDVWFKSVAPESGRMTFSTCGSTINTVMIVYDGSACGDVNAAPIACGSSNAGCAIIGGGAGTRITVPCNAGQTLLVRVGGLFGSSGPGYFTSTFACDADAYSPYSLAVRNSNPIDYWRFDDSGIRTAADAIRVDPYSCGNAPGEYLGNVSRALNFQGKALNLDGTGGYARVWGTTGITDPNQCPGTNGGASMEAWIKTTDPQAGVVLTNRTNPSEHSLTMVIGYNPIGLHGTSGKLMFVSDGPGNFFGAITRTRVDDGRWHHIVGRRIPQGDGTFSYEISVDDSLRNFVALAGTGSTLYGVPGAYWNIGNGPAWPLANAAFNGSIDEVAIYCGVLDDSSVINHYNIGRPCLPDVNFDHVVDVFDYLDFVNAFSAQAASADFNLDGIVDFFDYLDFVQMFAAGC